MKQCFILFGSAYLLLFTAPLWLFLLIWKKKDVKVIDEFEAFYDSAFRGIFDPIAKLFKVPKSDKESLMFMGEAIEDIKEGDVCTYDLRLGKIFKTTAKHMELRK